MRRYGNIWGRLARGVERSLDVGLPFAFWLTVGGLAVSSLLTSADGLARFDETLPGIKTLSQVFRSQPGAGQAGAWTISAAALLAGPLLIALVLLVGRIGDVNGILRRVASPSALLFRRFAADHVVIIGDGRSAVSLAEECLEKNDIVYMIVPDTETSAVTKLRRRGAHIVKGDGTDSEILNAVRAREARHVVAMLEGDAANYEVEAVLREGKTARRALPVRVHLATQSRALLQEARHLHLAQMRSRGKEDGPLTIDPAPFSFAELGARRLVSDESATLLALAKMRGHRQVHILLLGFDIAAEAVAITVLSSLWSMHFEPPKLTVLTPGAEEVEQRFFQRYPQAKSNPSIWSADIRFVEFDYTRIPLDDAIIDTFELEFGAPTAAVVSAGEDLANVQFALALNRICGNGGRWPIPIYIKQDASSAFTSQYARGDQTLALDSYLQAFGARDVVASRETMLERALDRLPAIAHEYYSRQASKMSVKERRRLHRRSDDVVDTYVAANRTLADSMLVKLWDLGWRPAALGEAGEEIGELDKDVLNALAATEHRRWVADRLLTGWRPTGAGVFRNNLLLAHDSLVPWEALDPGSQERDAVQVLAIVDIARLTYPRGFVKLPPAGAW